MKRVPIKQRLQEYFFVHPSAKMRVRELERTLKLPLPSVIRYCAELEQEGLLGRALLGSVTFYGAGRTSEKFFLEKKLYNIRTLYDSGLIEYLKKELGNPAIILFGSYAKGEDVEESDIDIYIESPSKKKVLLKTFEHVLKRKIQLFMYRNIQELSNTHLANNIINGISLNGVVEVFT